MKNALVMGLRIRRRVLGDGVNRAWRGPAQVDKAAPFIAQGIVATNELPKDKADYLASRIVETTGSNGNITGLLAEIELMKRPPVVEPPGGPVVPPPGGGTPPPGPSVPEPPPGGDGKPPVDPPVDPKPPVDPPADPAKPADPEKPADPAKPADPEKPADPAKPADPEKPADPAKPVDPPAGGGPTIGDLAANPNAMSPEEFEQLLASVQSEVIAEQGPHPVDGQSAAPSA